MYDVVIGNNIKAVDSVSYIIYYIDSVYYMFIIFLFHVVSIKIVPIIFYEFRKCHGALSY